MDELPEQAGLADPRLADHRHHLAVAAPRALAARAELVELGLAPDEAREAAVGGRLQAGAPRGRAEQLEDLHGLGHALRPAPARAA